MKKINDYIILYYQIKIKDRRRGKEDATLHNRTSTQEMVTLPAIESHYPYSHLMLLNSKLIKFSLKLLRNNI